MKNKKTALICGAGGFVGNHLTKRLKKEGYFVRGIDLKRPEFSESVADEFIIGDLRDQQVVKKLFERSYDEVYQLAAEMGGAGYVFTGNHDADIMHNSATINLNILHEASKFESSNISSGKKSRIGKIFFSSSACMYPKYNLLDPDNPKCSEASAYPADPDSEYGWEKLFSERLYLAFARNYGTNVRIGRFHNLLGPEVPWYGIREKAPAALCRKVAEARDGGEIEIWGDGKQTRSFIYIDECLEAVRRLMDSDFTGPVNIGSEEMVSINDFAKMIMEIAGKKLTLKHIPGPPGPRGRNSDNTIIERELGWKPTAPLFNGLQETYRWVEEKIRANS